MALIGRQAKEENSAGMQIIEFASSGGHFCISVHELCIGVLILCHVQLQHVTSEMLRTNIADWLAVITDTALSRKGGEQSMPL